ncbi:MAG: hypothetical protein QN125_08345 [Armatimonadota bacterium]|nr:hypothetical protein [Armatimonadota bacterium]MDR7422358.1 hypothetical protein [Armatimonadota bacterium]MDR7455601.1 hypothetical protein [Armatimonadota bacterium]MDR7457275.1 hypothetical protein [Armatimonadota bacterium]
MRPPSGVALALLATLAALVAPAAALVSAQASLAGEVEVIRFPGRPPAAELRVRGRPVARLVGADAARRLHDAARRLEPLLPPPTAIAVRTGPRGATLVVDGSAVLSLARGEARSRPGRPAEVAASWAAALEQALQTPALATPIRDLVLAPGAVGRFTLHAAGTAPVTVGAYDRRVVAVRLRGRDVEVTGGEPGSTVVPFRLGPYRTQVGVAVRPPAGALPPEVEVVVTGAPAPPELIRAAVERRLAEVTPVQAGATLTIGRIALDGPLAPGAAVDLPVAMAIRSPSGGPVEGTVRVRVQNAAVSLVAPDVLLVSNRPERITASGLLFQETVEAGRAARLLYHHLNGTPGRPLVLKITLRNAGAGRARVHYTSGLAGPSHDPVFIGYAATRRFLAALLAGQGYFVDVPERGAATFTAYTLPPDALVSGLMQVQVTQGGPVEVVVHVRAPYLLDHTVTTDLGPTAFPHPRGTFPGALVEIERELPAHEPAPVVDLGVSAGLRDVRTGEALVGDYGVLYRVRLRLTNPTGREVNTVLMANAAGGLARGLFVVDGAVVDAGLMRPYEDREIAALAVAPGGGRTVTVVTMPLAGSFYPVRLSLRPR